MEPERVTLGGEAKESSLLKDILGLGRFSPLLLFRRKSGACDCSGKVLSVRQKAFPGLSRALHS